MPPIDVGFAHALAAAYGLGADLRVEPLTTSGSNNQVLGVTAGGTEYVLKRYDTHNNPETIDYEHRLLAWLADRQAMFQSPVPCRTCDGDTLWRRDAVVYTLYRRLPGSVVWPPTLGHLEQIGRALAQLHLVLAGYPLDPRPGLYGYDRLDRVHPLLPQPATLAAAALGVVLTEAQTDDLAWWRDEVMRVARFVATGYAALPRQVIHGDYAPSNTLFSGDRICAIVDFEMAVPDARAMDLAAGLTFSMRVDEQADPWPSAAAFCRGYGSVQRLSWAEVTTLPDLMALRDVVSNIWWLGRGLAAGDVQDAMRRMAKTRRRQVWRADNASALAGRCAGWLC